MAKAKDPTIHVKKLTQLELQVDDAKKAAIQECLKKGKLVITLEQIHLDEAGRADAAYIYD